MKKLLLLTIAAASSFMSFGQAVKLKTVNSQPFTHTAGKTTSPVIHDTLVMVNISSSDSITNYFISKAGVGTDSGYLGGTNFLGMNGFAERYDFNTADSSVQVLGVLSVFNGVVTSTSTKNIVFKVWSQGPIATSTQPHRYNGFPGTILDSTVVPATALGLVNDSFFHQKVAYFTTPTAYLTDSFFVGYTTSYTFDNSAGPGLGGDTLGLGTTRINHRNSPVWYITGTDTMINVQNASSVSAGLAGWSDNATGRGFVINYYIFPIVNTKNSLSVHGITRKDFTFFGNYPNPAVNSTNIKFSLAKGTDVTIMVTDVTGKTVSTVNHNNLAAGEHIINLETANLPAGQYVYLIRTTEGDGIASQLTVIK